MDMLTDEVESLEAILMDDVKIQRNVDSGIPELIEMTILPIVGETTEQQYVCITLQVIPTAKYPETRPLFYLRNPRGLDDRNLDRIKVAVEKKLDESIGHPVVFDLIDVIREHLTDSNFPTGQCVVCLYGFQKGDEFTKTNCYHYLHSYCIVRHVTASKNNYQEEQDKLPAWQRQLSKPFQAVCPVCREPINYNVESIRKSKPPSELKNAPKFELTDELKELQKNMSNLFLRQKQRGGIIDLDAAETNVISIETESTTSTAHKNDEPFESNERNVRSSVDDQPSNLTMPNLTASNRSTHRITAPRNSSQNQYQQQPQSQSQQTNTRNSTQPQRHPTTNYKRRGGGGGGGRHRRGGGGGGGTGANGGYGYGGSSQSFSNAPLQYPGCSNMR